MPYSTLSPEIVLHIADFLLNCDLNSLLRTSKWHTSLLTPVLYNCAFNFDAPGPPPRSETRNYEAYLYRSNARGRFTQRMWKAASTWHTEPLVDYLLGRFDMPFITASNLHDRTTPRPTETTLLAVMVAVGNRAMMKLLLSRDDIRAQQLERVSHRGHTPLAIAVKNDDLAAFQMLLDAGADPVRNDHPLAWHILNHAADSPPRSLELVNTVIRAVKAAGGSVNVVSSESTPLYVAAATGSWEIAEAFLNAGSDPWAEGEDGWLPVQEAISSGQHEMAKRMLDVMLQRDPGTKPDWKMNVLHLIIQSGNDGVGVDLVPTLLESGVDVLARNADGKTALELVREMGQPSAPNHETWPGAANPAAQEIAGMLLRTAPQIWPEGHINRQLWELAGRGWVEEYHLVLLNILIRTGKSAVEVEGDATLHRGFTALHYVCDSIRSWRTELEPRDESDLQMVSLLLEHGASASAQSEWGETPLFCASRRKRTEVVRLLLQNPSARDTVNVADRRGMTPLLVAAREGDATAIRLILDAGADVRAMDNSYRGALFHALSSFYGNVDVVGYLLDAGCPVTDADSPGRNALHVAARYGFTAAIRMLVRAGCTPHARDDKGHTVLRTAVEWGSVEFVEELIAVAGEEIVTSDDKGSGDLVCATLQSWYHGKRERIAKILLKHGAVAHSDCQSCKNPLAAAIALNE